MAYSSIDGVVASNARNRTQPILSAIDTSRTGSREMNPSTEHSTFDELSSPTPLKSSKTAALFGSSSNVVRPTSLSVSSGSSSHISPPNSVPKEEEDADAVYTSGLSRYGSAGGSQRGNRQWENFEGKPVTPLPSPGVIGNESYSQVDGKNVFDSEYERRVRGLHSKSSSRNSSHDRQGNNIGAFDISISDSFSSIPSLSSMESIQTAAPLSEAQDTAMSTSSSKTKNFFGTTRPILPSSKSSYTGRSSSESSTSSPPPVVSRRLPSHTHLFYEPSRLPSAPFEKGGSISGITASSPIIATPTTRTPTLQSERTSELESTYNAGPLLATVSPPSPQPQSLSSDNQPDSAPSSGFLSSFPSSPPTQRNNSRHAYGPSEMATGSSLLPSRYGLINSKQQSQSDRGDKEREESYLEESEDETTGRIGRYQIEKTLGVGAFSRVALASEIRSNSESQDLQKTGRLVALKMLEREPCKQNERMRVSWVREVEILKHIVHPNIVRFLSAFSTPKHHNLILERVAGGELFDLVSNRHDSLAEREWLVRLLFGEMANAVGWMHSINLVHRDIKLENIILTHQFFSSMDPLLPSKLPQSPLLKISDFGLSRFVDPASPLLDTRCGSEEYAAPELIIGKRYDGRKTDVWALGVVLYTLLSGSLPFLSSQEDHHSIAKGYSGERAVTEQGSLTRKAHLLRIAKGDLRWPTNTNEASLDQVVSPCPPSHRLITPLARRLVARLIRRDALKRAAAWEAWDEEWLTRGSLTNETSANGETISIPLDPRTIAGQEWLNSNARVQSGALEITRDD